MNIFRQALRGQVWMWVGLSVGGLSLILVLFSPYAAKGLCAGGITSLLLFEVFYRRTLSILASSPKRPKKIFTLFFFTYIMVYFLVGGVLWLAVQKGYAFFGGYVLGILLLKIIIFLGQWRSSAKYCDDAIGG
jgi:hypothetical protein